MSMGERRRRLLLGGVAALVLNVPRRGVARSEKPANRAKISLATFGGVPGASPEVLIDSFEQAFAHLKLAGGGELVVPPGIYDFGDCSSGGRVISVDDLQNVVISAYGATFRLKTTKKVIPLLFYFFNPNNVKVAGASFNDAGYDGDVDWRGMYCVKAEANRPCSGFTMVDCYVNGAVGLFQSQQHGVNRYLMKDISLHGTVENAYYGAGLTYVGDNARVDLICRNVRRGCISFGLKNAHIKIRMSHTADAPGSNGFIALACEGESEGNVENVHIDLDVSGVGNHSALVHFYHVKSERLGYIRKVNAAVTVNNLKRGHTPTNVFVFDHELPSTAILPSTARGWDQIVLRGSVRGRLPGRLIHSPSRSTSSGTIYIASELATRELNMSELPAYFRSKYP